MRCHCKARYRILLLNQYRPVTKNFFKKNLQSEKVDFLALHWTAFMQTATMTGPAIHAWHNQTTQRDSLFTYLLEKYIYIRTDQRVKKECLCVCSSVRLRSACSGDEPLARARWNGVRTLVESKLSCIEISYKVRTFTICNSPGLPRVYSI